MEFNKVFIYKNNNSASAEAAEKFQDVMESQGVVVTSNYSDADILVCIGGDGAFLRFVHACGFPRQPIVGINTGHLGFFQEFGAQHIQSFHSIINEDRFAIQKLHPVSACIVSSRGETTVLGLNEVLFRGPYTHLTHFTIQMGDTDIQDFSGDGVLVSTSAGSTAYNYSLGGALAAPELDALQLTPIAPMNTNAYRCFRSSILYPADMKLTLKASERTSHDKIEVVYDGLSGVFKNVNEIRITQSSITVNLIRLESYNYWEKLKSKLL